MIRMLPLDLDRSVFCLYDDARLLAKCYYDPESGEIFSLEMMDPEIAMSLRSGLIKAVLSRLEYAGILTAWSENAELFPLLKTLRFTLVSEGRMSVSLKGYFDHACECK